VTQVSYTLKEIKKVISFRSSKKTESKRKKRNKK